MLFHQRIQHREGGGLVANPQRRGVELDKLDFDLIGALSDDPGLTVKAVASRLGVAESTCAYRLRRLREARVIGPSRLDLDHAQLGYALRAVVMVFLTNHSRETVDRFMTSMVQAPNVLQVINLTGRYDFMLTLAVADAEELRTLVLDHVTVHPSVRGTETHIVFEMREGTWIPPHPPR